MPKHPKLSLLLAALTACLWTTWSPAGAEPAENEAASPRRFDYLLYLDGARVGYVRTSIENTTLDDRPVILHRLQEYVSIRRSFDGAAFEVRRNADTWYEAAGAAIRSVTVIRNGNQVERRVVDYTDEIARITQVIDTGRPKITEHRLEGERPVLSYYQALRTLRREGRLKADERLDFRTVAARNHAIVDESWIVQGPAKETLAGGEVVEGMMIASVREGAVTTMLIGDDEEVLLLESPRGFRFERVAAVPDPFEADPLTVTTVMEARGITDFLTLRRLDLHFAFRHDDKKKGIPPLVENNAYHDVIRTDDGYSLRLHARPLREQAAGLPYPLPAIDDAVKRYLRPTPMCQADDPVLAAAAARLTRGTDTGPEAAKALVNFVRTHLRGGSGDTGAASARQSYDERRGDCTEHAALFVALARAAGLPARNINGVAYVTMPDGSGLFGYHAWAEVWLGEWIPVDTTVLELGTSARYIKFGIDEPGHAHGAGRIARCISQRIRPVIDAYELGDGRPWRREDAPERFPE